jgi:hypothetical protein
MRDLIRTAEQGRVKHGTRAHSDRPAVASMHTLALELDRFA